MNFRLRCCGCLLKKDKQGSDSEKGGTNSKKYCSMCYENGVFLTPPDVDTAAEMHQYCMQEMRKAGYNRLFAWLATRSTPSPERWRKSES